MGFLDRAFCGSLKCTNKCGRKMTDELFVEGIKWWGGHDFPYSITNFCDENGEPLNEQV